MKTHPTVLAFLFILFLQVEGYGQIVEKQLIGNWKHADVIDDLGAHVTLDIKPFDLTMSKDHHYRMTSEGEQMTGTWSLQGNVLLLNVTATNDHEARIQKLYLRKVTADTAIVEVKDFQVTGGFNIVMKKIQ